MAKGKAKSVHDGLEDKVSDEDRTRTKVDYVFEDHRKDGSVHPIGLTMHTPAESAIVQMFLEEHTKQLGIEGTIRRCKKIYS